MAVAVLNKQELGQRSANGWLLLLTNDLATFYDILSTIGLHLSPFGEPTSSCVFSLPLQWLPTTAVAPHHPEPTTPMQALVVLMKSYLKWQEILLATH